MKRTLITAPASFPVSLAEAKSWQVVEDTSDDALIDTLIAQATDYCERYLGIFLIAQTWEYRFDCAPSNELVLTNASGVSEVSSIVYTESDDTVITLSNEAAVEAVFYLDKLANPFKLAPINGWPSIKSSGYDNLKIKVVQGYANSASVPDAIKTAIYLMMGHFYRNREATAAIKLEEVPLGVESMLRIHKVISL